MTVEWIAFDVNTHQKPEVLQLCKITGEPIEVVFYRIYMLWSWFQMHSADGDACVTLESFATVAGGDAKFWNAVTQVGWLEETADGIRLPKFEERFSNAAKSKKRAAMRQQRYRDRVTAERDERNGEASPDKIRKHKTKREEKTTPAKPAATVPGISWTPENDFGGITEEHRRKWKKAAPLADVNAELAKASAWLYANDDRRKKTARGLATFLTRWMNTCQDGGGTRTPHQAPGPRTQKHKKFWRDEFCRNMTDDEYRKAKTKQRPATGTAALDLARTLTAEVTK